MADINHLVKAAETFHFRAVFAQQTQAAAYANFVVRKMQALVPPALASVNHLLSNPQYQRSDGLRALKSQLPVIADTLSNFAANNSNEFYHALADMINGLTFFTTGNVGTGHDSATTVSLGGYTPPSYYVNALSSLFEKLKPAQVKETPSTDSIGTQMQAKIQNKQNTPT